MTCGVDIKQLQHKPDKVAIRGIVGKKCHKEE